LNLTAKIVSWVLVSIMSTAGIARARQRRLADRQAVQTEYSFSVRPGGPSLVVRAQIGADGKIGAASVFHKGDQQPFQTFSSCMPDLAMELYEGEEGTQLVEHADFNFDGYEDLAILQYLHPHLGKSFFCVYLWDDKVGRFRYEPQIPMPDPMPDPTIQTITTHDFYQGGAVMVGVYVWSAGKVIQIAESELLNLVGTPQADPSCPWETTCAVRINGEMREIASKVTGCAGAEPERVECTPPRSAYLPALARALRPTAKGATYVDARCGFRFTYENTWTVAKEALPWASKPCEYRIVFTQKAPAGLPAHHHVDIYLSDHEFSGLRGEANFEFDHGVWYENRASSGVAEAHAVHGANWAGMEMLDGPGRCYADQGGYLGAGSNPTAVLFGLTINRKADLDGGLCEKADEEGVMLILPSFEFIPISE